MCTASLSSPALWHRCVAVTLHTDDGSLQNLTFKSSKKEMLDQDHLDHKIIIPKNLI